MVPGEDEVERERGLIRRRRRPRRRPGHEVSGAEARAREAWFDLVDSSMLRRGGGRLLVMDGPGDSAGICPLRSMAQVLGAALDLDRIGALGASRAKGAPSIDDLATTLELYRWGDGYAEFPGTDTTPIVDDARLALVALQAHDQLVPPVTDSLWLHRAKRTFEVVAASVEAITDATVAALTVELAARLHLVTGIDRFATIASGPDDHLGGVGDERSIGADLLRWQLTREPDRLAQAVTAASRALDEVTDDDRLWRRAPADNAALFGDLLLVHAVEPQPRALAELDRYLERVWREARDHDTGQFTSGGIGRSAEVGPTLDHAALAALFARQAGIGLIPDP
ncbi:MAG: hypothetical protein ACXWA3_07835 [Acidimicrobiales bacterium]